jgi:hypothetical protein
VEGCSEGGDGFRLQPARAKADKATTQSLWMVIMRLLQDL